MDAPEVDLYITANEMGVTGRINQHVGVCLNEIYPVLPEDSLQNLRFADYQSLPSRVVSAIADLPDVVLIKVPRTGRAVNLRAVGECKTPWTIDLLQNSITAKFMPRDDDLRKPLGKLVGVLYIVVPLSTLSNCLDRTTGALHAPEQCSLRVYLYLRGYGICGTL